MASGTFLLYALIAFSILIAVKYRLKRNRPPYPLPPGPKPLPYVGNMADLPPAGKHEWEHWLSFKHRYG
jgi:hypothetical protein